MAKICIVLHDLRGGGAEKMMVRLANQMIEDGDQVDMILITEGGSNKPYLSKEVNLIELRCERTLNAFGPLRSALKRCQPDGILAALTHINVITAITCASLGWLKKLSVSERNAFSLDKKVNSDKVMKATYFLAPYIYRLLPNPVIAVSKGVAQDLIDTTVVRAKDVVTAPNPVITKETELAAQQPPKHPWLIDKSMPTVIAVGRLSYQKGFDMLLDAFSDVQKKIPSRLIIFGEGELREELEQQVSELGLSDNVSLPGYSDNIIAEMKAADLYVLSSRFEGSPNAIVEAMSVGTQVVAFDCPHGAREILQDGRIAPLVQANCAKNLTHPISHQLNYISAIETSSSLTASVERFKSKNSSSIYRDFLLRSV